MTIDYTDLFNNFSDDAILNESLAKLIDEAHHIHFCHPEIWKREGDFKDYAAGQIANLIKEGSITSSSLINLKDRTTSMLTYRAIELLNSNQI